MTSENPTSPWADRLNPLLERETLRKALDRRPAAMPDLNTIPTHLAVSQLRSAFTNIFVATDQRVDLALTIVESAHAYCMSAYPDKTSFVRGLYQRNPVYVVAMLFIITGLAGVGKSTLMARLAEISAPDSIVTVNHEPSEFVMQVLSRLKVGKEKSVLQALLKMDLCPQELRVKLKANVDDVVKELSRQAYLRGVAYCYADELQHFTKSSDANTLVTELLLSLCDIGPPTYAVMNYSLGHRLKKRSHEDRDRLLSRPLILEPETKDSKDWVASIKARVDVCPRAFDIDPVASAASIHSLTLGIDRYLSELFALAYERQRRAGVLPVTVDHLRSAYASTEFSSARETLISIGRVRLDPNLARNHPDLTCPFPRDEAKVAAERADAASQQEEQRRATRMRDSLSAQEAASLNAMEKAAAAAAKQKASSSKGKEPTTGADLLNTLNSFLESGGKRGAA